ncbi:hypothetical protein [Pseudomonas urmiensis]|uniref:Uncharacterized protein n=1 Tax=Pseudomonas urmiensis TaxID=2745493 RepID=A0A923FYJ9_9PSED|nr:hypothetical protein [Pseudomonas urmiensis]MBV4534605.1 hypothetical protein [Pseudomonas urmiensis]
MKKSIIACCIFACMTAEAEFNVQSKQASSLQWQAQDCRKLTGMEQRLCQKSGAVASDCQALGNAHDRNQCLLGTTDEQAPPKRSFDGQPRPR